MDIAEILSRVSTISPVLSAMERDVRCHASGQRSARAKERRKERGTSASRLPFMGVDGEGFGTDELGRQHYMLMCANDWSSGGSPDRSRSLSLGRPLTTTDCLEFILSLPASHILVGFSFGYDATMILRDLSFDRRARLLAPRDEAAGHSRYTLFADDYGIDYLPRQFFRVCRMSLDPAGVSRPVPRSTRVVWETFGFFQRSFLRALKLFNIAPEDWPFIEAQKESRSTFTSVTLDMVRYCMLECQHLASLLTALRVACDTCAIKPRSWSGAGKLAQALHDTHSTLTRSALSDLVPTRLLSDASAAYYGGRFEVTTIGSVPGPIHEYDINSAYPFAMLFLPCLRHGRWVPITGDVRCDLHHGSLYLAHVHFRYHSPAPLYGLPIRSQHGAIYWPAEGNGWYWSHEIDAAIDAGAEITIHTDKARRGWLYRTSCSCHPFRWVPTLYDRRVELGKSSAGYPLKLGINSLYGKLAQRIGTPKYGNPIWAGLITSITRAALYRAACLSPESILMLATDGIYSTSPLPLTTGPSLGEWEHAVHPHIHIVQPGLYWGSPRPKTRGLPLRFFAPLTTAFEAAWSSWLAAGRPGSAPSVSVPYDGFIGLKLAQARGKPETAGQWVHATKEISYAWEAKRGPGYRSGSAVITGIRPGSSSLESKPYCLAAEDGTILALEILRRELDDQPDVVEIAPPWKDD